MPCYKPIEIVRRSTGQRDLTVACGQCIGCRLERSRQWAIRCMHEAQLHDLNTFITLTVNDDSAEKIFPGGSLTYRPWQLFIKRLRKNTRQKIRFYMCGEYGEQSERPHYHAALFGYSPADKIAFKRGINGFVLWRSPQLEQLWPYGHVTLGDVNFETAAYIARYVMKKVNGDLQKKHYEKIDNETGEIIARTPEFNRMSLKPGIGANWLAKFHTDVYPHGKVVVRGHESKPPRYYDKLNKRRNAIQADELTRQRMLDAWERRHDNSPRRLAVKEVVTTAKIKSLKRTI